MKNYVSNLPLLSWVYICLIYVEAQHQSCELLNRSAKQLSILARICERGKGPIRACHEVIMHLHL